MAFLGIPLVPYFWIQSRNSKISDRNHQQQARTRQLASADATLQQKIAYADQFATETVIVQEDLVYTTETDLLEQRHALHKLMRVAASVASIGFLIRSSPQKRLNRSRVTLEAVPLSCYLNGLLRPLYFQDRSKYNTVRLTF
jgi:hypothetical protein